MWCRPDKPLLLMNVISFKAVPLRFDEDGLPIDILLRSAFGGQHLRRDIPVDLSRILHAKLEVPCVVSSDRLP